MNNYKFYYCYTNLLFHDFFKLKNINYVSEFNIISCMFAFQYFWENTAILENILKQISISLKSNGYFIGVCANGDKIHKDLINNEKIQNSAVMITKNYKHNFKTVGNRIDFMLSGTLYSGENMISNEYLIYKDILIEKCKKFGLNLIEYTDFENKYNDMFNLNDEYKYASFLNSSFVFQKSTV